MLDRAKWYLRHVRHRLAHLFRLNRGDAVLFKQGDDAYAIVFRCECGRCGDARHLTRGQALRVLSDYSGRWELGPGPERRPGA